MYTYIYIRIYIYVYVYAYVYEPGSADPSPPMVPPRPCGVVWCGSPLPVVWCGPGVGVLVVVPPHPHPHPPTPSVAFCGFGLEMDATQKFAVPPEILGCLPEQHVVALPSSVYNPLPLSQRDHLNKDLHERVCGTHAASPPLNHKP